MAGQAENELHVELGQAVRHQQDGGAYPSICVNSNNTVVKINNSAGLLNRLYCNVGKIESGGDISWGKSVCYDSGLYPRVAINNAGTVVEVHVSQVSRDLFFRVGKVDTARIEIQWGERSHHYDSGVNPAIALLDDGRVISVHQTSALGSYATYYKLGVVDVAHKNIVWGDSIPYGRGRELALAANKDRAVVEVHKSTWGNTLRYRVGQLIGNEQQTITWGEDTAYGGGCNPCVAINSRGHLLEVHTSINWRRLRRRLAVVNTRTQMLDWVRDGLQYDVGTYPSICLNDNADKNLVETHQTNVGEAIWCRTGTLRPAETDE